MHDSGARRICIVVELHEVDFPLLLLCSVWVALCCLRYIIYSTFLKLILAKKKPFTCVHGWFDVFVQ